MDNKMFLNLVDTALAGDMRALNMCLRKIASKVRNNDGELYKELSSRISGSSLRALDNSAKPIPVDSDSRLNLVKVESPVWIEKPPIHSNQIKKLFDQVLEERAFSQKLMEEGLTPAKSLLFQGPPGVGKTMSARWLAEQLGLPLLVLDLATVMSSFLGKTGTNIRTVIDHAASFPCVLLLDEFDAIAKRRDDDRELGELKRLVTVLLQAIDDWPPSSILIAATNHGELLDPAIWRRFDIEVTFELPSLPMRQQYLELYWNELDDCAKPLAEKFKNTSFSDIDRMIKRAKKASILSSKSLAQCLNVDRNSLIENEKKRAIELHLQGLSQRAIERELGISRPTIKKAIEEHTR